MNLTWAEEKALIHRPADRQVKEAFGEWLNKWDWDWFVTLTLANPPEEEQRRGYSQRGWTYLWKLWEKTTLLLDAGYFEGTPTRHEGFRWFAGLELQQRGVPHLHALIGGGGLELLRWNDIRGYLWEHGGFNKWEAYDDRRGAAYYLTKYVTKDLSDWRARGLEQVRTALPLVPNT